MTDTINSASFVTGSMQVKRPADDLYNDQNNLNGQETTNGQQIGDSVKCFNNNNIDTAAKKVKITFMLL